MSVLGTAAVGEDLAPLDKADAGCASALRGPLEYDY